MARAGLQRGSPGTCPACPGHRASPHLSARAPGFLGVLLLVCSGRWGPQQTCWGGLGMARAGRPPGGEAEGGTPRAGGMHPAVSLASLQGCCLQPDLWAPTTALSPVPSGAADASPSMNLRKTPSPQTPPAPGCPRPTLRPGPQAWICCCPGCGLVLGVGPVGKREMKAQWEVGSPRWLSQCRTPSHKVARRAAGSGRWAGPGSRTSGPPGKSTGPPAHLQAGPRTRGETVGQHPLITRLRCPRLPGSPFGVGPLQSSE